MKKFIKERNPFLLISFIVSVGVFIYVSYILISIFKGLREFRLDDNIINYVTESRVAMNNFAMILFIFLLNASIFSMVGYIFKKKEYNIISIIIVSLLSLIFYNYPDIELFVICISWCFISVLGLIDLKK